MTIPFKIPKPHKDWYADGIESGVDCHENLWRLDPGREIQIQLFAEVAVGQEDDEDPEYTSLRAFIEVDRRDETGESANRLHYACKNFPLFVEEGLKLLTLSNEQAVEMLKEQIDQVLSLPNMMEPKPETKLTKEDTKIVLDALENPPAPTKAAIRAAKATPKKGGSPILQGLFSEIMSSKTLLVFQEDANHALACAEYLAKLARLHVNDSSEHGDEEDIENNLAQIKAVLTTGILDPNVP